MNDNQAGQILLVLRAAFPHVEVTPEMAQLWVHALATTDATVGLTAAKRWIETADRWPTIAQFNGTITAIRREDRDDGPVITRDLPAGIRCDGSGWFDRGNGLEACPACNEWNATLVANGDFHNGRGKSPSNWVRNETCSRWQQSRHDGHIVESAAQASSIMLGALTAELEHQGFTPNEIDAALRRRGKLISSMSRLADHARQ